MDKRINNKGFTLLEVLMAITLFGFFVTAFMMTQGFNISSSTQMRDELILHNLCESVINEAILNPPAFTNATENEVKTGSFDIEGYKNYQWKTEYKKIEIPEFDQLMGKQGEEQDQQSESRRMNERIRSMVFKKIKDNLEEIMWQLRVTVTNKNTGQAYDLSTWVTNRGARIDTNFAF